MRTSDGIDPDSCKNVLIENYVYNAGDDAIAVKSGWNYAGYTFNMSSENIFARNCSSNGRGGYTIGSEMSGGVRNVTFEDSTSTGIAGIRISSQPGRGGYVTDVHFRRLDFRWKDLGVGRAETEPAKSTMCKTAPHSPFLFHINQAYRSDNKNTSVVSIFSDFVFEDISASGPASVQVGDFTGGEVPITGVTIRNLSVSGEMATHSKSPMCCYNVSLKAIDVTPSSVMCHHGSVAVDSSDIDGYRCANDDGCQLNGACIVGACKCFAGWRGADCGLLDVLPSTDSEFPGLAYGSPPSSKGTGLASWGGSIVVDPANGDKFHLFAAEMSLGCGLNSWFRNSVIIHATSTSPLGPFTREEQVLGAFSHEPVVLTLPKEAGYVLYKIGCADNATTGSNGTWPPRLHEKPMVGRCHGCKNGVTDPSITCSHPDQVYERACQDALFATSLDGPWLRQNLSGFERSVWPWNDVNLGLESHTPILLANGKLMPMPMHIVYCIQ